MGRVGFKPIKDFQAAYVATAPAPAPTPAAAKQAAPPSNGNGKVGASVTLDPATLTALETAAKAQGKTLDKFLSDAARGSLQAAK